MSRRMRAYRLRSSWPGTQLNAPAGREKRVDGPLDVLGVVRVNVPKHVVAKVSTLLLSDAFLFGRAVLKVHHHPFLRVVVATHRVSLFFTTQKYHHPQIAR